MTITRCCFDFIEEQTKRTLRLPQLALKSLLQASRALCADDVSRMIRWFPRMMPWLSFLFKGIEEAKNCADPLPA